MARLLWLLLLLILKRSPLKKTDSHPLIVLPWSIPFTAYVDYLTLISTSHNASPSLDSITSREAMVRSIQTEIKRVIFARMNPGEDVLKTIEIVAKEHEVKSGQLSLIGAVSRAKLGYFHRKSMKYRDFTVNEDVEVVSCIGDISTHEGNLVIHAHMIVADENGKCWGGHLMAGCEVSVSIELVIIETEIELIRARDDATGLNLLQID